MARIRCFWLEPTERVRQKLRRYHSCGEPGSADFPCPHPGNWGYHNAEVGVEDAPVIWHEHGGTNYVGNGTDPASNARYADDPRWPTRCACGYEFTPEDARQLFTDLIYRRPDTGEEMTIREAPAGAMWFAPWADHFHQPQLAHTLAVKLPDGTEWQVDSQATNCPVKDDRRQEKHHCWVIEGTPPDITAGKAGPTCNAGAGSIQSHGYHGFLRNGWLED